MLSHSTPLSLFKAGSKLSRIRQFTHVRTRCLSSSRETSPIGEPPTVAARRVVFTAMLDQIEQDDIEAAEKVLLNSDLSKMDEPIRLFHRLLLAYSDVGRILDIERVFHLLLNNPELPRPDAVSYNIYLRSLPIEKQAVTLDDMIEQGIADTESFNTIIASYCSVDRPDEGMKMLERLMYYSNTHPDVKPDSISFSPLIRYAGRTSNPDLAEQLFQGMRRSGVRPDVIAWSHIIHAWAKSGRPEAPQRAMNLLNEMRLEATPDAEIYNVVMLAFAKARDRGPDVEDILMRMPMAPTYVSFSTGVLAWKNSPGIHDAVERAEALVAYMEQTRGYQKNDVVRATLIALYARWHLPERAELILNEVEKPNVMTYNSVLDAWSKSRREESIARAFRILNNMKEKPNVFTFTTVVTLIKACAGERNKIDAFNELNGKMRSEGLIPDIRTYSSIFRLCAAASSSPDAALQLTRTAFFELQSRPKIKATIDRHVYPSLFQSLAANKASFDDVRMYFQYCAKDKFVCREVLDALKRCCSDRDIEVLKFDAQMLE